MAAKLLHTLIIINLQNLLRSIKSGDYETPYKVGELEVYFKPIDYKVMNTSHVSKV